MDGKDFFSIPSGSSCESHELEIAVDQIITAFNMEVGVHSNYGLVWKCVNSRQNFKHCL